MFADPASAKTRARAGIDQGAAASIDAAITAARHLNHLGYADAVYLLGRTLTASQMDRQSLALVVAAFAVRAARNGKTR